MTRRQPWTEKREREIIRRHAVGAVERIDGLTADVISIAGAIQTGFTEFDADKAIRQLRKAADDLADMMDVVSRQLASGPQS